MLHLKTNIKKMKKLVSLALIAGSLLLTYSNAKAQTKIGYVSLAEFLPAMPEYKKADTSIQDYRNALAQNFEDMKRELTGQDSILSSKDTLKYTKAQLELKRKTLNELYLKVQGLQQKQEELIAPVKKKALDAIQAVAKENGYTFVFQKEAFHVYPLADDLLPLVKKKLGIK